MSVLNHHKYSSLSKKYKESEKFYIEPPLNGKISAALIYPNDYCLGMTNLGYLTVHRLLSQTPGLAVERFFPGIGGESLSPPFYSFDTQRPLGDFEILLFSFSFEGDFDNIPSIFAALGLPLIAKKRNKHHPLLIAGGAAVMSNSEALADIFDILIPAEAETTIKPLFDILMQKGFEKDLVAQIPGIMLPSCPEKYISPVHFHNLATSPAYTHIVSKYNAFGGAHIIEVMRGCPRICSFCLARSIYKPVRHLPKDALLELLNTSLKECNDLGLTAPSLFDHPEINDIALELIKRNIKIRNSSVKWEKLTPEIIDLLRLSGTTGLTLAPETGSEHLRAAMQKPMSVERFLIRVKELYDAGFEHLKMYFMTCLPGETKKDVDETAAFIEKLEAIAPSPAALSANFSVFIPKKQTFWENEEIWEEYKIKKHLQYLKSQLSHFRIKIRYDSYRQALRQAHLAKVGRELAIEYENEVSKCAKDSLQINLTSDLEY